VLFEVTICDLKREKMSVRQQRQRRLESKWGISWVFFPGGRNFVPDQIPATSNGSEFISKVLDKWAYEMRSRWTSPGPGIRLTMRSSNLSTAAFVTSV
jgi:hypothetical protein